MNNKYNYDKNNMYNLQVVVEYAHKVEFSLLTLLSGCFLSFLFLSQ